MQKFNVIDTDIGYILIAYSEIGLNSVRMGNEREKLIIDYTDFFPEADLKSKSDYSKMIKSLIHNPFMKFDINLDIKGTEFQKSVWNKISEIKAGNLTSYKEIATDIGKPKAFRAVANACGANQVPIVIPCHRVVGSNGYFGGFRWGVDFKKRLNDLEKERL